MDFFTSHISGRSNIFGSIRVSVHVSVHLLALGRRNRWNYGLKVKGRRSESQVKLKVVGGVFYPIDSREVENTGIFIRKSFPNLLLITLLFRISIPIKKLILPLVNLYHRPVVIDEAITQKMYSTPLCLKIVLCEWSRLMIVIIPDVLVTNLINRCPIFLLSRYLISDMISTNTYIRHLQKRPC